MAHRAGSFVLVGLLALLGCSRSSDVVGPGGTLRGQPLDGGCITFLREGARVPDKAKRIDFENLPSDASSCPPFPSMPRIDNPLSQQDVVFLDPFCLRTGYCSAPTCPEGNVQLALNQGGTISFGTRPRDVILRIEGLGDVPFAIEVVDRLGRTQTAESQGILFGTVNVAIRVPRGISQIRVVSVGPTPDCPQSPCGPLAISELSYE